MTLSIYFSEGEPELPEPGEEEVQQRRDLIEKWAR